MNGKVPFPLVQWCVETRCKCQQDSIPNLYCDKGCQEKCLADENAHGSAHAIKCVADCGCDLNQNITTTLFALDLNEAPKNTTWTQIAGGAIVLCLVLYIVVQLASKGRERRDSKIAAQRRQAAEERPKRSVLHFVKEFEEDGNDGCHYEKLSS